MVSRLLSSPSVQSTSAASSMAARIFVPAEGSFCAADLGSDAGWHEAVAGCDFVLHVASPIPLAAPEHDDDLILPAREGTLRVLRASRDANVKRVVLTSSSGAI